MASRRARGVGGSRELRVGLLVLSIVVGAGAGWARSARGQAGGPREAAAWERARAIRPAAMAAERTSWDTWLLNASGGRGESGPVMHLVTHQHELRLLIDSLLLELAISGVAQWLGPGADDQVVALGPGNVELGGAFRDTPAPGWRYELGGGLAAPTASRTLVDDEEPPGPAAALLRPATPGTRRVPSLLGSPNRSAL